MLSATAFEHDDVGYFVSNEALQRYNLESRQWLAPIDLENASGTPTVALVDDDGIYAAFGSAVYRYNLDGTGRTHLLNAQRNVRAIHSDGNVLLIHIPGANEGQFISISKSTNTIIAELGRYSYSMTNTSISPETNRIFGRSSGVSPSDVVYLDYTDSGTFGVGTSTPYHGDYAGATKTWVSPDGTQVLDDSGAVYATTTLMRVGSLPQTFEDIAFHDAGVVVVSDNTLTAYSEDYLPTGSRTLGHEPHTIYVHNASIITFRSEGDHPSGMRVNVIPLSSLEPESPGPEVDPNGLAFTPDKIELAADGSVLLFSKTHQSIFRWDPAVEGYTQSIPLLAAPSFMTYSGVTDTIYVAYGSGLITSIDADAADPEERPFITTPEVPLGISTAGQYLFVNDGSGAWSTHYTFAPDGSQVSEVDWNYVSAEFVWNDANQKMYYFSHHSPRDIYWEQINVNGSAYPNLAEGAIGVKDDSPLHSSTGFTHPIRVKPDGSVIVLGSGMIHDATSLARSPYALANTIVDAAWLEDQLFTVRNIGGVTQFQEWGGPTYEMLNVTQTNGTAHALHALDDDHLLAVLLDGSGVPQLHVIDRTLLLENEAPELDSSVRSSLFTIREDAANPYSTPIAKLLAGVTDSYGASPGIAVAAAGGANDGTWEYTLDGGGTWQALGAVSINAAKLLPADGTLSRIRFVPGVNFNGDVLLTFVAWDQTEGEVGDTVVIAGLANRGGSSAYSENVVSARLRVTSVNDLPELTGRIGNPVATPGVPFQYRFSETAFTDADRERLTYTATLEDGSPLPAWLMFDPATRTFSGTPDASDLGPVNIRLTATDPNSGSTSTVFSIRGLNTPPELTGRIGNPSVVAGEELVYRFSESAFSDANRQRLTYTAELADSSPLPGWLTFDAGSRTFSGTPTGAEVGEYRIRLTATDPDALSASTLFTIRVEDAATQRFAFRAKSLAAVDLAFAGEESWNGPAAMTL